jgi:hypothetical protein
MKKLLLVSLLALWLLGCGKEEPIPPPQPPPEDYTKLPPETQEGKNTFGCMIYNQVWVPRVPIGSITVVAKSARVFEKKPEGNGSISCRLISKDPYIDDAIIITFGPTMFMNGTSCDPNPRISAQYKRFSTLYQSTYRYSPNNCVTITHIDTIKNIVSGTFAFDLYRDSININDKIVITDGRFDLKYSPQ